MVSTVVAGYTPEPIKPLDQSFFSPIVVESQIPIIQEGFRREFSERPSINQPEAKADVVDISLRENDKLIPKTGFILDSNVSWYGPDFYGNRTACGQALTKDLLGVAHKSLPCGTLVTFKYGSKQITVPVVDRGPYVDGRQWDLTGGLCVALDHCFTGQIYYRIN